MIGVVVTVIILIFGLASDPGTEYQCEIDWCDASAWEDYDKVQMVEVQYTATPTVVTMRSEIEYTPTPTPVFIPPTATPTRVPAPPPTATPTRVPATPTATPDSRPACHIPGAPSSWYKTGANSCSRR